VNTTIIHLVFIIWYTKPSETFCSDKLAQGDNNLVQVQQNKDSKGQ